LRSSSDRSLLHTKIFVGHNLNTQMCRGIFKNLPLEEKNIYCYFQCVTQVNSEETFIKQIGVNTYAITNPQPTLFIKK